VVTLVGGEDYQKQLRQVDKRPVDIVVATPGRLIDFLQQDHLYLGLVELLVIDEADRMLDMGFIPQVRTIVSRTPHKDCRQTLLFSATFTPEIIELTSRWAMDPIMIEIQPERVATDNVEQLVYLVTAAIRCASWPTICIVMASAVVCCRVKLPRTSACARWRNSVMALSRCWWLPMLRAGVCTLMM
jgi:hypothetical protein